ncbi:hypothetical protein POX_a01860 [Penicillium oxalicum]|uniref:Uncharacterized protein n=1 Tax=Penicillium oxalicum (strain 114-2 / CGMCC 5302) TaxID=933388 RepID=S8B2T0_PENO1|nr:hypothetical protein POX_a01860 [Penicillium oxalicum]EPS33143.1 hypothetical protein PDE_08105 [Penicillium oxalicum 114-2]KAI2795255.1 hypothetical protein POX_a01860 [Penicillium oxalicum]
MSFRDRVKRVFRRPSAGKTEKHGRPKVEYYRRGEIPPSKFKGPFDKEHQRRLAAWSFDGAMADRPRPSDLSLSPCATYDLPPNDSLGPLDPLDSDEYDLSPDVPIDPGLTDADADASGPDVMLASLDLSRPTVGSQSSTAVNSNSESYSGSLMTLLPDDHPVHFADPSDDPIALLKESIRYTSPIVRAMSPAASPYPISPRGKSKGLPFSPEDLTRALIAVQVCA